MNDVLGRLDVIRALLLGAEALLRRDGLADRCDELSATATLIRRAAGETCALRDRIDEADVRQTD